MDMRIVAATLLIAAGSLTAQKPQPKATVLVIIGSGLDLKCGKHGCTGPNAYWTGTHKVYVSRPSNRRADWPAGWSPNWKDAVQYTSVAGKAHADRGDWMMYPGDRDPDYDIPNGAHCCYAEYPTPINSQTGNVDYTGWK